jgi:hypothetical protein
VFFLRIERKTTLLGKLFMTTPPVLNRPTLTEFFQKQPLTASLSVIGIALLAIAALGAICPCVAIFTAVAAPLQLAILSAGALTISAFLICQRRQGREEERSTEKQWDEKEEHVPNPDVSEEGTLRNALQGSEGALHALHAEDQQQLLEDHVPSVTADSLFLDSVDLQRSQPAMDRHTELKPTTLQQLREHRAQHHESESGKHRTAHDTMNHWRKEFQQHGISWSSYAKNLESPLCTDELSLWSHSVLGSAESTDLGFTSSQFEWRNPYSQIMGGIYLGTNRAYQSSKAAEADSNFDVVIIVGPFIEDQEESSDEEIAGEGSSRSAEKTTLVKYLDAAGRRSYTQARSPSHIEAEKKEYEEFRKIIECANRDKDFHERGLFGLLDAAAKGEKKVLVISFGAEKGASLLMEYLLSHDEMDLEKALRIIWHGRPSVNPAFYSALCEDERPGAFSI